MREIPDLAHIVVARRPGVAQPLEGEAGELLESRGTTSASDLARAPAGRVLLRDVTQLEISSSAIRALVAGGGDPRFLVPDAVLELIAKTHIYANPREARTSAQ
mgnify:FL=1